jgi:hypothetical protein
MKRLFTVNKFYTLEDINTISITNDLATVDCLKDEQMISIEAWNQGDGSDCLYEFHLISPNAFQLRWSAVDLSLGKT